MARLHRAANGLPRALNNAAIAALIAAASAGKALVDDACAVRPPPSSPAIEVTGDQHVKATPDELQRITVSSMVPGPLADPVVAGLLVVS